MFHREVHWKSRHNLNCIDKHRRFAHVNIFAKLEISCEQSREVHPWSGTGITRKANCESIKQLKRMISTDYRHFTSTLYNSFTQNYSSGERNFCSRAPRGTFPKANTRERWNKSGRMIERARKLKKLLHFCIRVLLPWRITTRTFSSPPKSENCFYLLFYRWRCWCSRLFAEILRTLNRRISFFNFPCTLSTLTTECFHVWVWKAKAFNHQIKTKTRKHSIRLSLNIEWVFAAVLSCINKLSRLGGTIIPEEIALRG